MFRLMLVAVDAESDTSCDLWWDRHGSVNGSQSTPPNSIIGNLSHSTLAIEEGLIIGSQTVGLLFDSTAQCYKSLKCLAA